MSRSLSLALVVVALGCGRESDAHKSWEDPAITPVSADDPEMNAAIARAQETLPEFVTRLEHPKPEQSPASLKAKFTEGSEVEHIWLGEVQRAEGGFSGVLGNTPVQIKHLSLGERVTVKSSDVSDWMFVEDGKLVGGYSIRLFYQRMSPEERAEFEREMPFKLEK